MREATFSDPARYKPLVWFEVYKNDSDEARGEIQLWAFPGDWLSASRPH